MAPVFLFAQQGLQGMNYQAIARDALGSPVLSQSVCMRFTIHTGSGGPILYQETQTCTTNGFGVFTHKIGMGTATQGTFAAIPWSAANQYLQVEMDENCTNNYVDMGTSELLSVPFALYAANSPSSNGNVNGTTNYVGKFTPNGSTMGNSQIFDDGSHVGIGWNGPINLLDVNGNACVGQAYAGVYNAPTNGLIVQGSVCIGYYSPMNLLDVNGAAAFGQAYAGVYTAPPNGMIIQGNVAIGYHNAINMLDVNGGMAVGVAYAGVDTASPNGMIIQGNVAIGWNKALNLLDVNGGAVIGSAYAGIVTAPSNGLAVQGRLGVGVDTPSYPLTVMTATNRNGIVQTDGNVKIGTFVGSSNGQFGTQSNHDLGFFTNDGAIQLMLKTTGSFGIGTTTPGYLLEVNGTAGKPGGGSWTTSSDRRLKTNINDYNAGLNELMNVHPVSYEYNGINGLPTNIKYVGVIAQELKEIAPDMVGTFTGKDGNEYYNVDPSAFDYMLINAVKELKKQNDKQQAEIDQLKKLINQK